MAIKQAIRSLFINDATLTSLIGARVSPRISKTGDTLPRVVYLRTNVSDSVHTTGSSSLRIDSFNFIIESNSSDECDTISERIKLIFESVLNQTHEGTFIRRCLIQNENEGNFYPEGREKPIYETMQGWNIIYNG